MTNHRKIDHRERLRAALVRAYESAVVIAAQERGHRPKDFVEATLKLPAAEFSALRQSFADQLDAIPLSSSPGEEPK